MSMFTICREIVAEGELQDSLDGMREAEANFTAEVGVLDRRSYQCVQQPHVIWANTEWTTEKAHNLAAEAIMKVRKDDRVASAYFRPGLYFEIFCLPVEAAWHDFEEGEAGFILLSHAVIADRAFDRWEERCRERLAALEPPPGLRRIHTYQNNYSRHEFVTFFEWRGEEAYEEGRLRGERTLEELVLIETERSNLAAYCQFECRPLVL